MAAAKQGAPQAHLGLIPRLRVGGVQDDDNVYVPRNMPAIGDLFDLFHFGHDDGGG
jgi:hypothetical protein